MTVSLQSVRSSVAIAILSGLICLLEIFAPTEYAFGDLYVVPILLASFQFGKIGTSIVTIATTALTLLDFLIPNISDLTVLDIGALSTQTLVNRLDVVVVLLLTNWLTQRNLKYLEKIDRQKNEIAYHKAALVAQLSLTQMREDFVQTLTHDLKTPLLGAIQTIKCFQQAQFGSLSNMQFKVLNTMSQSQQRSLQLVEMLLDVYRNDAEGLVLQCQSIDLYSIARESVDAMKILGLERHIKLNIKCYESVNRQLELIGDPLQLSRVFSNLLSNAIYHSPRGGQIDVTIYNNNRRYIVQISDRGQGIAPEDLPLLFDRFYQAQDKVHGSGLGLYLSRQIVEAHGGKIWAESELPQGTKFCFNLPIGT
jgi:two-component system, NarL family, sensor kinase